MYTNNQDLFFAFPNIIKFSVNTLTYLYDFKIK